MPAPVPVLLRGVCRKLRCGVDRLRARTSKQASRSPGWPSAARRCVCAAPSRHCSASICQRPRHSALALMRCSVALRPASAAKWADTAVSASSPQDCCDACKQFVQLLPGAPPPDRRSQILIRCTACRVHCGARSHSCCLPACKVGATFELTGSQPPASCLTWPRSP